MPAILTQNWFTSHFMIVPIQTSFRKFLNISVKCCQTGVRRPLRGPPRKNQTKMNFFRQGSKIEILSIFAYK